MEKTETDGFRRRFVTELSGGEKQRVVFARALAQEAPVLVLDEATSNMDIRHTLSVLNQVQSKVREEAQTVIAVFQDINLAAAYCDQLIFMQKGCIDVCGPTDEVLNSDTLSRVFQVQAKVYHESYTNTQQVVFKH
jgi:iron complex transport system ATP-binding protein